MYFFFFSSRRRHTRLQGDWSSDVCSSDLWPVRQAERDIARDREPGQEARLLEHDADLFMRRCDCVAVERNISLRRTVEPGDEAQQRGLAAAGAADYRDDLARFDIERNGVE